MPNVKPNLISFLLTAAFIVAFLFSLNIFLGPTYGGDVEWYIAAAEGRLDILIEPYSARFLHPFLVGTFSRFTSVDIYKSFLIFAVASIFLFFVINIVILKNLIKTPLLLFPLFFLPYFFDTLRHTFHPDAFYLLLTAFFFLLLSYNKEAWSLLLIFLLFLTRESTILLGVLFSAASWIKTKKILAAAVLIVIAISLFITSSFVSIGESNIHGLGGVTYLFAKLSYNAMTNIFGVIPWADTYKNCAPVIQFSLPHLKILGNIKKVGVCGFDFGMPLKTLLTLLTLFGMAPLLTFYILLKKLNILSELPFWLFFALIYGIIQSLFGVVAGTGVWRIVGYGYPAFILAAPFLIKNYFGESANFIKNISLLHLSIAWTPFIIQQSFGFTVESALASLLVVAVLYFFSIKAIVELET